jgi:hypothetical protein
MNRYLLVKLHVSDRFLNFASGKPLVSSKSLGLVSFGMTFVSLQLLCQIRTLANKLLLANIRNLRPL